MASGLSRSGSLAFSTLSVLHENQAMKMEREELKTQINVISARVCSWIAHRMCFCDGSTYSTLQHVGHSLVHWQRGKSEFHLHRT